MRVSDLMLTTALLVGAPALLAVTVVGLLVSLVQALVQVQEQTLSFVPKLLAGVGTLILLAPWMLSHLVTLARTILGSLSGGPS